MRFAAFTPAAALALIGLTASPALAQDSSLDTLEQVCIDDGSTPETCDCLRGFVSENFTQREIDGAAMIMGNPELEDDVPAAFGTLIAAGYQPDEMISVYNRIVELESEARSTCVDPGAAPQPTIEAAEAEAAAEGAADASADD